MTAFYRIIAARFTLIENKMIRLFETLFMRRCVAPNYQELRREPKFAKIKVGYDLSIKIGLVFIASLLPLAFPVSAASSTPIILVHGALFTGDVWSPLQTSLEKKGYQSITMDTPGRLEDGISAQDATLSAAVEKLCQIVTIQSEPVMLLGHNQGGAIITQATAVCPEKIKGLIYLAAVLPWPGEHPFDLLSNQDNEHFDLSAPLDMATGLSNPDLNGPIHTLFMADADTEVAQHVLHNMVSEPIIFAYNSLDYNRQMFDQIPKYYIKTTQDLIIEPTSQDIFIRRQPMNKVFTLNSSHCPFVSQPEHLADVLAEIVDLNTNA